MTTVKTFSFPSSASGYDVAAMAIIPSGECIAIVQFVHGMAEHKERYIPFMQYLAQQGYLCVIHDHQGHGNSIRNAHDLGYFHSNDARVLLQDIHQLHLHVNKQYPNLPNLLFGHSMGSLLARAYCKRHDEEIDALIVCGSPSKNSIAPLGKGLVRLLKTYKGERYRSKRLHAMVFGAYPKRFQETHSENVWLCSDMDVVEAYDRDPLCGFIFTLNGFENLFTLMQMVYHKKGWECKNKELDILFIAGEDDPCIQSTSKYQEAASLMKTIGYRNVKAKLFPGMRHEILNEKDKEKVYSYVKAWLDNLEFHKNT